MAADSTSPTGAAADSQTSPRFLALALGGALTLANSYWLCYVEMIREQSYPSILALSVNGLCIVLGLLAFNRLVARFASPLALRRDELLVIYIMVAMGTTMSCQLLNLVPTLTHSAWFATPDNRWESTFLPQVPSWLIVRDKNALRAFYFGTPTVWAELFRSVWLLPMIAWTGVMMGVLLVCTGINLLLRRPWIEAERLTYPVMQTPLLITEQQSGLWRNRLFLGSLGLILLIELLNGLHMLVPAVPNIPTQFGTIPAESVPNPWRQAFPLFPRLYPFAIGIGYLMPLELSLSCVFFYWFQRLQRVFLASLGYLPGAFFGNDFPYLADQAAAAIIAICLFALWGSRRHLHAMLLGVWKLPERRAANKDGLLGPRAAFLCLLTGGALLCWLCFKAGMTPLVLVVFLALYFAIAIGIGRMRAEMGPPAHDLYPVLPGQLMIHVVGSRALGTRNLTILGLFFWLAASWGGHPMPVQSEGLKVAQIVRTSGRRLLAAASIAGFLGIFGGLLIYTGLLLRYGAATSHVGGGVTLWYGPEIFGRLFNWVDVGQKPSPGAMAAMGWGFSFALILLLLRSYFPGWPLHPLGFALTTSWYLEFLWLPLLVSWFIKGLAVRYGGRRAYQRLLPVFLGMIVGDALAGAFWTILGIALGIRTFSVWSG